jgi:hypothetical protein
MAGAIPIIPNLPFATTNNVKQQVIEIINNYLDSSGFFRNEILYEIPLR